VHHQNTKEHPNITGVYVQRYANISTSSYHRQRRIKLGHNQTEEVKIIGEWGTRKIGNRFYILGVRLTNIWFDDPEDIGRMESERDLLKTEWELVRIERHRAFKNAEHGTVSIWVFGRRS